MKIENKVALVTGGADGIGKAVSQRLLEKGAKFVAILDINEDLGKETVNKFSEKFGSSKVRFIHCNVADDKKLKECFQEAFDVFGTLDIVVNNAGVATANHRRAIEINLIAVINGCFYAEELMTKQKREEKGVIVNTASMADDFSKDLRVAAICPGLVLTSTFVQSQDMMDDASLKALLDPIMEREVNMSVVVDGFILAIEDESLHGAIITTTKEGVNVESNLVTSAQ
ncbi:15-hydroxyprostaglandin dehydrogenase [Apostichopus japonicus]|uniref:15-hydroxyprostaglandin dehydrogenase [NAD(+)] n=1 Tax=Stichopus japonicus TaxID=307972 RepID=A0A2G8JY84_STIJA|nr:15-hydroxyprostaglandin dehydrogenase [Apostichopus japonicus]